MAKKIRNKTVTKTEGATSNQLVVQQLNVMSADRSRKDIGDFRNSLQAAESVWNPNRVRLYDLYNDIMLDGHLTGIISKRMDAVLNKNLHFEDAKGKRIEAFDDLIESEEFRDVMRKILETPLWGITGLEFLPGAVFCWKEIPRKHIKPEKGIIALEQQGNEGVQYKDFSNLWIMGKENDLGLLLKCSPYALYKRGNIGDWAQYVEIFGQPVRVFYYDAYDNKTRQDLQKVIDESGSSLAMMIPNQAKFEMLDGKSNSNGTGELQERFKIAMDSEMSIIILGNTETTTSSKSSGYAQSKEHGKQQLEITKSDLKYILSFLNSSEFLTILKSYGYPVEGKFKFEKEIDLDSLKTKLEIDKEVSTKVPTSDEYWYETYGLPKPDNYDELKAKQEAERLAISKKPAPDQEEEEEPVKTQVKTKKVASHVKTKKLASQEKSFLYNLRAALADFFDQAR